MKDNSTLKSLNRQLEVKFKEAKIYLSKLEKIFSQRREVEESLENEIRRLQEKLLQDQVEKRNLFLSGTLKPESVKISKLKHDIQNLEKKLLIAQGESKLAEKRIEEAKLELEQLYREKEGFLKIEDEREVQNERIKLETIDSN